MAVLGKASNPTNYTNKQANRNWYADLGLDYAGDNEVSAIYKRLLPGLAEQAFAGQALRSELEPQRQGAVRSLVALNDPSNLVANAGAAGARIQNDALAAGRTNAARLGQLGAGAGTQLGAVADAQNQGISAANRLMAGAYSPEQQSQALANILQTIQSSPGDALSILMQMFAPIEQRSMANKADKAKGGMGSLGGILGAILPGLDLEKLFAGGGVPGLGGIAGLAAGGAGGGIMGAG